MRVFDVHCGKSTVIEVVPSADEGLDALSAKTEVELFSTALESEPMLRAGEQAWAIDGRNPRNRELLEGVLLRALPRLAWVSARAPGDEKVGASSLVLEVREFPYSMEWGPDVVDFGVGDEVVDSMRRKRRRLSSIDGVLDFLDGHMRVASEGGRDYVLLSGGPGSQLSQRGAFRLHGKGWAVDVKPDSEGRLLVTRVTQSHRAVADEERRPILLVRGRFRFVDQTVAGRFRGTARSELDRIVGDADSYLSIWSEYNKLENRSIQRRAHDFGWLTYRSRQRLADGRWRFLLSEDEQLEDSIRALEEGEVVELEAAESPPSGLTEPANLDEEHDVSRGRPRAFTGECVGHDRTRLSVDLRLSIGRDEDVDEPPKSGVLFMSLGGDRTRLGRRWKAQASIARAECPMPQLGLLLEGKTVPERRRRREAPLSAAARLAMGGEPTSRQVEALNVALNTPDIALIQGPPGTGKTRTIAALQVRLSEISEVTDGVSGRYLLTSYQHDAVENVANATQVYGLPAVKVGQKRGQDGEETDGFERWRMERVEAVRAKLATVDELPAAIAYQRCRDLTIGYLRAPSRQEDIERLLNTVREYAASHVPPPISDELLELAQRFRRSEWARSDLGNGVEQALTAVRGLRTTAAAFGDDGDTQARRVLRRLKELDVLTSAQEALLERAAAWDVEIEPDFLAELEQVQRDLIDRLLTIERSVGAPMVLADVEQVLAATLAALREAVNLSRGGVGAVLHEFLDDLENDQAGAREAVERYTSVLAATCQQAVGYQMSVIKGESIVFETVVVDEAARANPLDLFIPMALAERRIVLVGDHRQLPHILDHEIETDLDSDVATKTREMLRTSLFQRLFAQLQERERHDGIKRTVTLDVQYRMHPVLGDFISDVFYAPHGEGFSSGRPAAEFAHGVSGYRDAAAAWVDVPLGRGGERRGRSKSRPVEARWIAQEAQRIMVERPELSVGVISFYSAQVNEILRSMEPLGVTEAVDGGTYRVRDLWRTTRSSSGRLTERLRVGTVDAFQGKEFDVVLLSMTRSNDLPADEPRRLRSKYGHLMLENRLCVAMSRQQRLLIVVGDSGMLAGELAKTNVPGLVRFLQLCEGAHGVRLHA